jgi:hypothetical protein
MLKTLVQNARFGFCATMVMMAGFSLGQAAPKTQFGIGTSVLIQYNCEALFGYLEYTQHKPNGKAIVDFLKLPNYVDPNAVERIQPNDELKRAMDYAASYVPSGLHAAKGTPLSHHRAFILKSMLVEISRVYPFWTARVFRNSVGDFMFSGDGVYYIKVSHPAGEISRGDNLYELPD